MSGAIAAGLTILAQEPPGCGGLEHALISCHNGLLPTVLLATAAAAVVAVVGGVIAAMVFPELMNSLSGLSQALTGSAAAGAAGAAAASSAGGGGPFTLDKVLTRYDQLGDTPPEINLAANETAYAGLGVHSLERHGPDIPLEEPLGSRTIKGRIYGAPPWAKAANWSHRWTDWTTMHRIVNEYLYDNWESIRSDLALDGEHANTFNVGRQTGEGYYNAGMYGAGDPEAVYHAVSLVRIVVQTVPGSDPPQLVVYSAYPTAGVR